MHERSLDNRYRIQRFAESDQVNDEAVIAFWSSQGVPLSPADANKRVREVLFLVLHETDGLVGLCTVYLEYNERLRMNLWHYRTFVAREHREADLAFHLLHHAREYLNQQFSSGMDTRAPGMMIEVENALIKKYRNEAIWPTSRFAFIGENERGDHCRVYYFPGARVPGPGDN